MSIILNSYTLNSLNDLVAPETVFGTNLAEMCSIGEWKELVLEYTYDEYDGSVYGDIIGNDVFFNVGLFNYGAGSPSPSAGCQGFYINLSAANGIDEEMILSANDPELRATLQNYKCYINTSDGIDFTIKFQFYMTMDIMGWLGSEKQINHARFLKDYKSHNAECASPYDTSYNSGLNSVYTQKRWLDTYLKIYDDGETAPSSGYVYRRDRLDFYGKFYNEDSFFANPSWSVYDSVPTLRTDFVNDDMTINFFIDYTDEIPSLDVHAVATLFRVDSNDQSVDFTTNYDLSQVEIDAAQTDNHIKQPTVGVTFIAGSSYYCTFTIDGASLPYGSTWRMIVTLYTTQGDGTKRTASFLSDEYLVNRNPVVIGNPYGEGMPDWNSKEVEAYNNRVISGTSPELPVSYIHERLSFNGLSIFDPAANANHPYASIDGWEQYCKRIRIRIYRNDNTYKHIYATLEVTNIDWANGECLYGMFDYEFNIAEGIGDPVIYPYLKQMKPADNIAHGYFFEFGIRSMARGDWGTSKYLASEQNSISTYNNTYVSTDTKDWGDKTFGIDYTYMFEWPDGSTEVVTNSYEDILIIKDFDNETGTPQTTFISSIKDSNGVDLNVRKYIALADGCDPDSDLILETSTGEYWLPVYAYNNDGTNGGLLSVMLSPSLPDPRNIQEVNVEPVAGAAHADWSPLDMIPQANNSELVRNAVQWSNIGGIDGSAYFELNISKLAKSVDYKLYVIQVYVVET